MRLSRHLRTCLSGLGLSILLASPLTALCGGESLADLLSAEEAATVAAEAASLPYPEGILWQATRGDREILLIGTMHIFDPRLDDRFDAALPLLGRAEVLFAEATLEEEAEMQAALLREPGRIFIVDGPTLPERLPEEDWQALAEAAQARLVPPFMAAKMQPWYLTMALAMPPCAMPDLVAGRRGLDHMLLDEAARIGLPARSLEPWDTVLDLFAGTPEADQMTMLRVAAAPPDLQTQTFVAMLDGYFAGEIARIWALSRVAGYRTPGLSAQEADAMMAMTEDLLLSSRNAAWIEVIEAAPERTVAVAVGALHLPGETGLLQRLADAGYRITRLD